MCANLSGTKRVWWRHDDDSDSRLIWEANSQRSSPGQRLKVKEFERYERVCVARTSDGTLYSWLKKVQICSVEFYVLLPWRHQHNKKYSPSRVQLQCGNLVHETRRWNVVLKHPSVNNVERSCCEPMLPCCPIVAPEKQVLHHGTGHSSLPATTCAIGHNVAHFLDTWSLSTLVDSMQVT